MTEIMSRDVYAPYFQVEIEGQQLPNDAVISVSVDESLDAPAKFEILINESMDIKTQQFLWLDNSLINPGNNVRISFGYAGKKKQELFSGVIKVLTPGFQATGIPSLKLAGFDLSHSMQKRMTDYNGKGVSYSDIAAEIGGRYGLGTGGVERTEPKQKKVERKKDEKDYAFLRRMAEEEHFEFFIRGDTLYFREPKDHQEPVQTFQYNKNLVGFNPRLSMAALIHEVIVTGWNENTKEAIKENVILSDVARDSRMAGMLKKFIKGSDGLEPKKIEYKALKSKEEAKKKGEIELKRNINTFIQGDLECIGDPGLRSGTGIKIEGIGQLFSGNYYILTTRHSFSDSGYKTTLGVRKTVL
jgi:uncharacterized protein